MVQKQKLNKGGRPKIDDPKLKSDNKFTLYFNGYEIEKINKYVLKELGENHSKSDFYKTILLNHIENKSIIIKTSRPTLELSELNSIGNNVNQIAKKLNSVNNLTPQELLKFNLLMTKLLELITE